MDKGTCIIDGCGRGAQKRRWCSMHYQRGKADGSITNATVEELAWENVDSSATPPPCPLGAKLIPLTDGTSFTIVDEADYNWLMQWRWWPQSDGYAYRHSYAPNDAGYMKYSGVVLMHRIIMDTPKGMDTDHINRNPLDNRRCNLRITDRTQNNFNSGVHVNNTSGHRGVSWNKRTKSWRAYIGGSKGRVELGRFKNIEDAIAARLAAEETHIDKCA